MQDQTTIQPSGQQLKCPRCDSIDTKFWYMRNRSQARHRCKKCYHCWAIGRPLAGFPSSGSFKLQSPISRSSTKKESNKPRGGLRDIAWQHGVPIDNGTKSCCNYCKKVMQSGGATRLKQHLAGGFTNVEQCSHCPPEIREMMLTLLKLSEEHRLEKEREKGYFQARIKMPPKGDQRVDNDKDEEEDKDPQVKHLEDATSLSPWMGQSSYEVGGGSTQTCQSSEDGETEDTSSGGIIIESYLGPSNTHRPRPKRRVYKGPWTAEEDQILKFYIEQNGDVNWQTLPKKAGLLRSPTSCRLRWTNYLKPDINVVEFTREEEDIIINLFISLGNRWSVIAKRLPGRTAKQVKDVWNTHLKKRLLTGQAIQDAPHHTVKLSTCEANMGRVPNHIPKTDLVNVQSDVSTMSGSDIGSVSDVGSVTDIGSIFDMGSVSGMDESKGCWDTFMEFPKWSEFPFSVPDTNFFKQFDECSSDFVFRFA